MNINLHMQGAHILFDPAEVQNPDGGFVLLADIPAAITIAPGRFAKVPTPAYIAGDGSAMGIVSVAAGRDDEATNQSGQFLYPNAEHRQVEALVMNHTPHALVINPKNAIGALEFIPIAMSARDGAEEEVLPDNAVRMPIVFEPQHIDASNKPAYELPGSAGFDLRADIAEAITLAPGERKLIPTGIRIAIPSGYEGQIRPRSGLALKNGITIVNSPGTIDEGYAGICGVVLLNTGSEPFVISPADRIAQMIIAPVMRAIFDFQSELPQTERGDGGFGSTGVK
jgi:dUTP pyrophosphatase